MLTRVDSRTDDLDAFVYREGGWVTMTVIHADGTTEIAETILVPHDAGVVVRRLMLQAIRNGNAAVATITDRVV